MDPVINCTSDVDNVQNYAWHSCLRTWDHKTSFLLKTGQLSDVSFTTKRGKEKLYLKAHKLLLAISSSVFYEMFHGDHSYKIDEIEVNYEDFEAIMSMLNFIYLGTLKIKSLEAASQLYYVSRKYALDLLLNKCIDYISTNIVEANAIEIYEFAYKNGEEILMTRAMQNIQRNARSILVDETFILAQTTTVEAIFGQNDLNVESEIELIVALAKYSEKNDLTKESIRKAVSLIRFQTLTDKELSECREIVSILHTEDHLHVLLKRVPEDLNQSVESRGRHCSHREDFLEHRATKNFSEFHNSNQRKSTVVFSSTENVAIVGILIGGQKQPSKSQNNTYCEELGLNVIDTSGKVLYTQPFVSKISYDSVIDVKFSKPFRVEKMKKYKLEVSFKVIGVYRVQYSCTQFEAGDVILEVNPEECGQSLLNGTLIAIDFTL